MTPGERRGAVMGTAIIATSMAFIDATALNVALDAIQRELEASSSDLLWIVNGYAVLLTAFLLLAGSLSDRFGRKKVFATGIVGFAAASLGCALAPAALPLIAFRALQGLAAAFMIPGSLMLITDTYPREERGKAVGLWSACTVLMMALGPVLGGLLAEKGWWRAIFYINLPLAALALVFLLRVQVQSERVTARSIDWRGAFWSSSGLGAVSFAFIRLPETGIYAKENGVAFVLGMIALVFFVLRQRRAENPMLPLALYRVRVFSIANLLTLLVYSTFHVMMVFIPLHLIQVEGYSAAQAGLAQLPVMLCLVLCSPLAGKWFDRSGLRPTMMVAICATAAAFVWMGTAVHAGSYWLHWFPGMVLFGIGIGFSIAPLSTTIMNAVPDENLGLGSAINSALSRLASVLGVAVLGGFAFLLVEQYVYSEEQAFKTLSYLCAGLVGLGVVLVAGIKPEKGSGTP